MSGTSASLVFTRRRARGMTYNVPSKPVFYNIESEVLVLRLY